MRRLIFYGETFGGRKGIEIGDYIYCCEPLEAIKRYCNDELHYCDMDAYTWVLCEGKKETIVYKGDKNNG